MIPNSGWGGMRAAFATRGTAATSGQRRALLRLLLVLLFCVCPWGEAKTYSLLKPIQKRWSVLEYVGWAEGVWWQGA